MRPLKQSRLLGAAKHGVVGLKERQHGFDGLHLLVSSSAPGRLFFGQEEFYQMFADMFDFQAFILQHPDLSFFQWCH